MNVVYVSNENYAQHLAVSMASLFDSNLQAEEIHVYVLSTGISPESEQKLQEIAGEFGRQLSLLDLRDIGDRFGYEADGGRFDISAMGRFFLGNMLPAELERVIYLDCDTAVLRPLEKLWETDLHGKVLGAVMEPTIYPQTKAMAGLDPGMPYYNSGVLLIDLVRWRSLDMDRRLREFFRELNGRSAFCDQDAINAVLKGQILPLMPKYNFFSNYKYFHYKDLVRRSSIYRLVPEKEFTEAAAHPAVVHYAGDERPWIRGSLNPYRRAYDFYLARTPWAGAPKIKGKELYMLAYHVMNLLTWHLPALRAEISRRYGEKLYEDRMYPGSAQ